MWTRFDWRKDEEAADEVWEQHGDAMPHPRPGGWRIVLALLGLGVFTATVLYWQQTRRLRAEAEQLQQEVAASYTLWQHAVSGADFELFVQLLSNENAPWQSTQRHLFSQKALLDRSALGLSLQALAPTVDAVTLSANWQQAELAVSYPYTPIQTPPATIRLQQTVLYRRQRDRWAVVAPDDAFWGQARAVPGDLVQVIAPERDVELAQRIARDLDADLASLCAGLVQAGRTCPAGLHITVRFETDPASLTALQDLTTPAFRRGEFILPAPTLVGLPADEAAYAHLYRGYTGRILHTIRNNLSLPIPLPHQDVQLLCTPQRGGRWQLLRYDVAADSWAVELPQRRFFFLSGVPDDAGVVLREALPDLTQIHLLRWQAGQETPLLQIASRQTVLFPVGWAEAQAEPRLLLQETDATRLTARYRWLDFDRCGPAGCELVDMFGFPVWSPDGTQTLLVRDTTVYRGNAQGEEAKAVGEGFGPFWVDATTFGYVRYAPGAAGTTTEVVLVDGEGVARPVLRAADLPGDLSAFIVRHVAPNPADPGWLFVGGVAPQAGSSTYTIFSFRPGQEGVRRHLTLNGIPTGSPRLLTPTGYVPFVFSPDGRWLTVTRPGGDAATWTFSLHDVIAGETHTWAINYPRYPARYPFYDWAGDGRWLLIVDDGFLRLVAPGHDYQRLVPYNQEACFFAAWTD